MTEIHDAQSAAEWMDRSLKEGSELGKCPKCDRPLMNCECAKTPPRVNFRTLHDRILVKRDDAPEKIGSIYVPTKEPPNRGKVVAIGRDRDVAVGDRVLFIKNAGNELKIGDEKRLIMFEMDIYGVLEGDSLRPISNKVLIKPDPPDEKRGLIIIPDPKAERAREQLVSGEIMAMGQGMRTKKGGRWPMADVKVGQRVLYFQNYTPELSIGGVTYVVVADDQLRAVIEE